MTDRLEDQVASHYGGRELLDGILAIARQSGADLEHLTPETLGGVDELHIGGRQATMHLIARMTLRPSQRMLDVGCGVGGAARSIAAHLGCHVTGIDLTPDFISVARELTLRSGLQNLVDFEVANALSMPFSDGAFDAAVTIHAAMNIKDRNGLYREVARVLKKGAAFHIYDVMKGPALGLDFPVPWAESADTSHVITPAETQQLLESAGFDVVEIEDRTEPAIAFFRERAAAMMADPPPAGPRLFMGANYRQKFVNLRANLENGRAVPCIMMARRR